jgi:hypothetical protein
MQENKKNLEISEDYSSQLDTQTTLDLEQESNSMIMLPLLRIRRDYPNKDNVQPPFTCNNNEAALVSDNFSDQIDPPMPMLPLVRKRTDLYKGNRKQTEWDDNWSCNEAPPFPSDPHPSETDPLTPMTLGLGEKSKTIGEILAQQIGIFGDQPTADEDREGTAPKNGNIMTL